MKKEYGRINGKRFGELMAAFRKLNSMTQQAVADYLGIKRPTYAKYETGRKPEIDIFLRLCTLYGVTADEFLAVFTKDVEGDCSCSARFSRQDLHGKDDRIMLLNEDEIQILELFRKSVRKDEIMEYAKNILEEENSD